MFYNINRKAKSLTDEQDETDFSDTPSKAGCDRLKTVLLSDKHSSASRIQGVIKSDFYCMLLNYMEVDPAAIRVDITCDSDGIYILRIEARAKRIFNIGFPQTE